MDSSIVIAAERQGETVEKLIERMVFSIGLTELVRGIYRGQNPERRLLRQASSKSCSAT